MAFPSSMISKIGLLSVVFLFSDGCWGCHMDPTRHDSAPSATDARLKPYPYDRRFVRLVNRASFRLIKHNILILISVY